MPPVRWMPSLARDSASRSARRWYWRSACAEGVLARYEREHRKLALRPLLMARLMLTLDGRPRLQDRTLQTFQKYPAVFRRLLGLHVGVLSPLHLAVDGLTLGWGLLTA